MKKTIKALVPLTLALALAAPMLAQYQPDVELPVNAHMDIYRAGEYNDGSDGIAPAIYSFPARPFQTLTFSSVSGSWTCTPSVPEYSADGTGLATGCIPPGGANIGNPVGTFSGYDTTDFSGAMAGMFLEDALPSSAPPPLRFYVSDNSLGGIQTDFKALAPRIGQVFFIGDGLTGTGIGNIQVFRVPHTATHLYLGYVDSCNGGPVPSCYSDNLGSLTAVFQIEDHELGWTESSLSGAPAARTSASMVYDPAMGATLLYGGDTYSTTFGDTWMYSKATGWTPLTPAVSPPPLAGASMAYDPTTETVVLFGGLLDGGTNSDETWTWDGASWTQQFPAASPSARVWNTNGMVFDSQLGKVVLFGGEEDFVFNNETWEWDGTSTTWTQQFPANSPSLREATLAYDEATNEVVFFGGWTNGIDYGDTWTYNGVDWVQRQPATSPPPRADNGLAFDPILRRVVLFGGLAGSCEDCGQGRLNDTWLWDGSNWSQVQTSKSPNPSSGVSLTYDGTTKAMLLFGGWISDFSFTNSTWLFGPLP